MNNNTFVTSVGFIMASIILIVLLVVANAEDKHPAAFKAWIVQDNTVQDNTVKTK